MTIIGLLGICMALGAGFFFDKKVQSRSPSNATSNADPYIELSMQEEDFYLVGNVVKEWMKGEKSATDLYNQYREAGRVYTSESVKIKYSIYNIWNSIKVVDQTAYLSTDDQFEHSTVFSMGAEERSLRLDYLYVDTTYYFKLIVLLSNGEELSITSSFKTAASPRIITIEPLRNIRDIGGWVTTDGKVIKQGLLYRGSELDGATEPKYQLDESGIQIMLEKLGIKTELDLRASNLPGVQDVLGESVKHNYYSFLSYSECFTESGRRKLKNIFSDLANPDNYPIYLHCAYGADRTGTVCYFLEAILGLSEEDLYREWELSILQNGGAFFEEMDSFVETMKTFEGSTMKEKAENYLLSIGVTQQEIDSIREIFLGSD